MFPFLPSIFFLQCPLHFSVQLLLPGIWRPMFFIFRLAMCKMYITVPCFLFLFSLQRKSMSSLNILQITLENRFRSLYLGLNVDVRHIFLVCLFHPHPPTHFVLELCIRLQMKSSAHTFFCHDNNPTPCPHLVLELCIRL